MHTAFTPFGRRTTNKVGQTSLIDFGAIKKERERETPLKKKKLEIKLIYGCRFIDIYGKITRMYLLLLRLEAIHTHTHGAVCVNARAYRSVALRLKKWKKDYYYYYYCRIKCMLCIRQSDRRFVFSSVDSQRQIQTHATPVEWRMCVTVLHEASNGLFGHCEDPLSAIHSSTSF